MSFALLVGCATTSSQHAGDEARAEEKRFPSQQEVADIAARPLTTSKLFATEPVSLETWEFTPSPVRNDGPWLAALQSAANTRGGLLTLSEELGCAAEGVGRILLEHKGMPSTDLRNFIEGRCASTSAQVSYSYLPITLHGETTEAKLFEQFGAQWEQLVKQRAAAPGLASAHVWFGMSDTRAVAIVASSSRLVHLTQMTQVPDETGNVVFEGEVLQQTGRVHALINHGEHVARPCTQDSTVQVPRFRIACPVLPSDSVSWVELSAFAPGQVLGHTVMQVLAYPSGTPVSTYVRPTLATAPSGDDVPTLQTSFLRLLNAQRAAANLPPLTLAVEQSRTATSIAPHYFVTATAAGEERMVAERIALGLLAGWDIGGIVRDGSLASQYLFPTRDSGELLAAMLQRPSSRSVLMSPDRSHIALGAVNEPETKGLAMVATTYTLFDPNEQTSQTRAVYERIDKLRSDRKVPETMTIQGGNEAVIRAVNAVQSGKESPEDALEDLISSTVARMNMPARGWRFEVSRLEDLQFPEELLTEPQLGIELAVAYRRPPGAAWGHYIVLLVAITPPNQVQQASLATSATKG